MNASITFHDQIEFNHGPDQLLETRAEEMPDEPTPVACRTCGARESDDGHDSVTWDVCPACLRPNRHTAPLDAPELPTPGSGSGSGSPLL